jgi:SAM-dependent methyltransferase
MEASTYAAEAALEARHWWFVGRRRFFTRLIAELGLPPDAAILDAGTGTGANLRLLRAAGFTNVTGLDFSPEAIRHCAEKGLGTVQQGDLCALPFGDDRFDLVLATDVLEHLDDDAAALAEIRRVLKPGGTALVTVPAFPSLWGLQDEVAHHRRRYRMGPLRGRVTGAGLECRQSCHFNYLLFLPIWMARQVIRLLRVPLRSENDVNAPLVNGLLTAIFRFDTWTARWVRPPFGVSILALCRKPLEKRGRVPLAA